MLGFDRLSRVVETVADAADGLDGGRETAQFLTQGANAIGASKKQIENKTTIYSCHRLEPQLTQCALLHEKWMRHIVVLFSIRRLFQGRRKQE